VKPMEWRLKSKLDLWPYACAGGITGAKIEHPLRCSFSLLVISEFGLGIGKEAIDKDIIRHSLVERFSGVQGGSN
jgi:hypothetical protein